MLDMSEGFPLIQLPRKSEAWGMKKDTPKAQSKFPLIQLPRKSEAALILSAAAGYKLFPLIQLPRKSEVGYKF